MVGRPNMSKAPPEQPDPRICRLTDAKPSSGAMREPTAVALVGSSVGFAPGLPGWRIDVSRLPGAAMG